MINALTIPIMKIVQFASPHQTTLDILFNWFYVYDMLYKCTSAACMCTCRHIQETRTSRWVLRRPTCMPGRRFTESSVQALVSSSNRPFFNQSYPPPDYFLISSCESDWWRSSVDIDRQYNVLIDLVCRQITVSHVLCTMHRSRSSRIEWVHWTLVEHNRPKTAWSLYIPATCSCTVGGWPFCGGSWAAD